jgi:hypothetical protein
MTNPLPKFSKTVNERTTLSKHDVLRARPRPRIEDDAIKRDTPQVFSFRNGYLFTAAFVGSVEGVKLSIENENDVVSVIIPKSIHMLLTKWFNDNVKFLK